MTNTGKTVKVELSGDAYLSGGPLTGKYKFECMYFHWGSKDDEGSEHTVDGRKLSFEAQLLFKKSEKALVSKKDDEKVDKAQERVNIGKACVMTAEEIIKKDKEIVEGDEDGPTDVNGAKSKEVEWTASIALLFQVDETAKMYNMFTFLSRIVNPDTQALVDANLFQNFKSNLRADEFYTYTGSLTMPPQTECVTWIVYKDIVPILHDQLDCFRTLRSKVNFITSNWSNVKRLNGRQVMYPVSEVIVCPGKWTCGCGEQNALNEVLCYRKTKLNSEKPKI